jgi:hypothetical protein
MLGNIEDREGRRPAIEGERVDCVDGSTNSR